MIKWSKSSYFFNTLKKLLIRKNTTFSPPNITKYFIVYELDTWPRDLNSDFTSKDFLFGGVKLAKNPDPDKYAYTCYAIGFNSCSEYLFLDDNAGKNVIVFEGDMSSSVHIDNKNKDSSIFGKGPTQRLDDTMLTAKAQYSFNFARPNRKFCLI